jgi:DNA-binding transcriptional regulator YiaG
LVAAGEARRIREAAGVSQTEVAQQLGVSRSAVCLWELGHRLPRGNVALRYFALLESLLRFGERAS